MYKYFKLSEKQQPCVFFMSQNPRFIQIQICRGKRGVQVQIFKMIYQFQMEH